MPSVNEFMTVNDRDPAEANRLLLSWLSDDTQRAGLYRDMQTAGTGILGFRSRANVSEGPSRLDYAVFAQDVYLIARDGPVREALGNAGRFSNSPYRALGSGDFMLGLDGEPQQRQHAFAWNLLAIDPDVVDALASRAFDAGAVLALKQRDFDLAAVAEQIGARYVAMVFGYAQSDHALLCAALRAAFRSLCYQIIGRHFVADLGTIDQADAAACALVNRTADLIDLYRHPIGRGQSDELAVLDEELDYLRSSTDPDGRRPLRGFLPILRRLAEPTDRPGPFSGTELAVIVVGLMAGTVGNIQSSVCTCLNAWFRDGTFEDARTAALKYWSAPSDAARRREFERHVWKALCANPPAAFLPRRTIGQAGADLPADRIVLVAVGAATRNIEIDDRFDPDSPGPHDLVFGGGSSFAHRCVGRHLAMPAILHATRQFLLAPGLAERHDPRTGALLPLEKTWGIICERYPLQYCREGALLQDPLIVVMDVRKPVAVHAEALKLIIAYGAPSIEAKLKDAQHVHFAWFKFVDGDSKLMLCTVYDRGFDPYVKYFAMRIGPLFDLLFEHLEDAPPRPVNEFPKEFVDTIWRHNTSPVGGYFFSAYPMVDVSTVRNCLPPEER